MWRITHTKLTSGYAKLFFSSLCALRWFYSPPPNPQTSNFLWGPACRGCWEHKHSSLNSHQYKMLRSCSTLQKSCPSFLRAGCPGLPKPPSSHVKWHHLHDIQCSDFLIYNLSSLSYTAEENYHTPLPGLVTTRWRFVLTYSQPPAPQSTGSKEATWTLQSNMTGELKMLHCICSSAVRMREM